MRPVEMEVLRKTALCGTEDGGYQSLYCVDCGTVHRIRHSCKTRLCPWCGKKEGDKFARRFVRRMLPVTHRHVTFTIPDELWRIFHADMKLLQGLPRAAYRAFKTSMEMCLGIEVVPGCMAVAHNFGRDLKENCHPHMIVTEGGLGRDGKWVRFTYFPFVKAGRVKTTLNELWRDEVLDLLRTHLPDTPWNRRFIAGVLERNPGGFYVYAPSKERIKTGQGAERKAKYITRYAKHLPMSDSRLERYDGKEVEFWCQQPSTGEKRWVVMPVMEFMRALLSHVPEKHFRAVMYYGLYSPNHPRKKIEFQAVFDSEGVPMDPERLSWKERVYLDTGRHPGYCAICGREMVLVASVYWKNGDRVVYYRLNFEDRRAIQYPDEEMWLSRGVSRLAR